LEFVKAPCGAAICWHGNCSLQEQDNVASETDSTEICVANLLKLQREKATQLEEKFLKMLRV
jgi:hypothetical protein